MYSIGEFAVMLNVNKKTLRYYDEIDLFKPCSINPRNQYRYYDKSQVSLFKEIRRLKEIGLSLQETKKVVMGDGEAQLRDAYLGRLNEIDNQEFQLALQKKQIEEYLSSEQVIEAEAGDFVIEKSVFINAGNVFFHQENVNVEDVNSALSKFYAELDGMLLTSGHIFRRSLNDTSDDFCEIFAYTSANVDELCVRKQEELMCLRVICEKMSLRDQAVRCLFDHAEENGYVLKDVFEKYAMKQGHMYVEIMGSL